MKTAFIVLAALTALAPSTLARPKADYGQLSWGKAGVSYFEYRIDALECTAEGTLAILGETTPNSTARQPSAPGSDFTQNDLNAALSDALSDNMGAAMRARNQRQDIVDRCLLRRGYTPFLLNASQRAQLRTYDHGSQARRDYLYALARDARVLEGQGVEVPASEE